MRESSGVMTEDVDVRRGKAAPLGRILHNTQRYGSVKEFVARLEVMGLAEEAFDRLRRIAFEGEHIEKMAAIVAQTELSPGVIKTLMRLSRSDGISMGEMARSIGCDPSYITALVDDLADHGLATREPGPDRPPGQDGRPDGEGTGAGRGDPFGPVGAAGVLRGLDSGRAATAA